MSSPSNTTTTLHAPHPSFCLFVCLFFFRPRLGDSLFKVVAAGVAYFVLALIDGIMRARSVRSKEEFKELKLFSLYSSSSLSLSPLSPLQDTFHTSDTSSVVTLALLLLLDTFIFYWIFTAIVDTRRTLRLRKNYVKLSMYNHFAYTLIFAIIATVGFITWVFVALEYPSEMCLTVCFVANKGIWKLCLLSGWGGH